jgi:hypothetical protein
VHEAVSLNLLFQSELGSDSECEVNSEDDDVRGYCKSKREVGKERETDRQREGKAEREREREGESTQAE